MTTAERELTAAIARVRVRAREMSGSGRRETKDDAAAMRLVCDAAAGWQARAGYAAPPREPIAGDAMATDTLRQWADDGVNASPEVLRKTADYIDALRKQRDAAPVDREGRPE